jgi:hypothetical protein
MLRKIIIILIVGELIFSQTGLSFAYPGGLVANFLYEKALKYYRLGNLSEALHEASKILLFDPTNKEAIKLIEQIKKEQTEQKEAIGIEQLEEIKEAKSQAMLGTLDRLEKELLIKKRLEERKLYKEVVKEIPAEERERALLRALEEGKKVTEEEEKPVVIAMEKVPAKPKEKIAPQWVIKPAERVTSKELEDYYLLSEAKLFINDNQVEITPIIIKDSDIRLPLEKLAEVLDLVVFSSERGTLTVISPEGLPLEFRVGEKYEGWTMIALEDLGKVLDLETNWDKDNKIITVNSRPVSEKFITFTQTKPKEVKPEEIKTQPEEKPPILGRLAPVPEQLQPDIRLELDNYVTSSYDNLTKKSLGTEQLRIAGDIYDYKLDSEFKWKETDNGHFLNDGKYIGFFKEDLWLKFLNLSAIIPHLRAQAESYEGAEITKFYNPYSTKVYTGQRDITVSGPSAVGAVRYYGHLVGAEQRYASDAIDIKQSFISTEAEAETQEKAGTTAFPRRNLVSVTDTTLNLPYQIDLSGQYALCNYNPDNNKDTLVQDNDWRMGVKMDGEKLLWGYTYEFVGDEYASLGNPSTYQDYKGWDLYSRYRLTKRISASGTYSESQDNVDSIETQPTNKNKNLSLGTNFSLASNTNLSLNWLRSDSQTQDPTSGMSSSTSYDYLLSLFQNWKDLFLMLTYDHYDFEAETGSFSDTASFSLYKFMPKLRGSYFRARQQIKKTEYKESTTPPTTDYNSDFSLKYYLMRNFSVYGNVNINNIRTEGERKSDLVSLLTSVQWDVNKDTGLGLDFNFAPYDLSNKQNCNSRAWSVLFRFFNRFEMNSPSKWGKIKGRVFKDLNGNGVYDNGEPTFAAVAVSVPEEFIAQTDQKGQYVLEQIVPGAKTVKIEMKDLPIELISPEGEARGVTLKSKEIARLDFPLVEASSIKGEVFIDENNNGVYDLGEEGLEDISIYLSPKLRTSKSDENGRFFFEFLSPGSYEVSIDPGQVPLEYKLASPEKLEVKLLGGQEISDTNFCVILKPVVMEKF